MKILSGLLLLAAAFMLSSAQAEKVVSHTVIEGETIEMISGKYDITVTEIRYSNGLTTDELIVGTIVKIPAKNARGYFDAVSGVYHVAKGDNLSSIAQRFEIKLATLKQANALKSDTIHPNQTLLVPGAGETVVIVGEAVTTGTVVIEGKSVSVGIGFSWGSGTLTYGGQVFPFKLKGLKLVGVGASSVKMTGIAQNLNSVADFAGKYTGMGGGLTAVAGGSSFKVKNKKGVELVMTTYQQGLQLDLGGGGLNIEMQ